MLLFLRVGTRRAVLLIVVTVVIIAAATAFSTTAFPNPLEPATPLIACVIL